MQIEAGQYDSGVGKRLSIILGLLFLVHVGCEAACADAAADALKIERARQAEADANADRFHEVKKRYYHALLDGDVEAAKRSIYMRPEQMPLLNALIKRFSAESRYCDAFELYTGVEPEFTVSTRRRLREGPKWEVEIDGDVASEWKMPYRKIDGEWRVDIDERDYINAMTERIPVFEAETESFDLATKELKRRGKQKNYEAARHLRDLQEKTTLSMKEVVATAEKVCSHRLFAGVQGTWKIIVYQRESPLHEPPPPPVQGTLTINGDNLTIQTTRPQWNGGLKLIYSGLRLNAFKLKSIREDGYGEIEREWSIERCYERNRIFGTFDAPEPEIPGEKTWSSIWGFRSEQRADAPARLDVVRK